MPMMSRAVISYSRSLSLKIRPFMIGSGAASTPDPCRWHQTQHNQRLFLLKVSFASQASSMAHSPLKPDSKRGFNGARTFHLGLEGRKSKRSGAWRQPPEPRRSLLWQGAKVVKLSYAGQAGLVFMICCVWTCWYMLIQGPGQIQNQRISQVGRDP